MIISRTPFRISFFGGGTDYPAWYRKNGGAVLATTIDKYCYISTRYLPPFFEHKHRIVYSVVETVTAVSEIKHPAVREILKFLEFTEGLEIHHDGDLPARSGLGSSSAFTVGLLNTLLALRGQTIPKYEMAKRAIFVEQDLLKETVGSQDQITVSYGGFNKIDLHPDDSFVVNPVVIPAIRKQELNSHLMLFYTGKARFASEVAQTKIDNFKNCESELKGLHTMVDEAISILQNPETPIQNFGALLHQAWLLKRSLSKNVSSPEIDSIYEAACKAGAIGGKILGAGGGGFMLLFVKPESQDAVRESLKKLVYVNFKFENEGSKIVLYTSDR